MVILFFNEGPSSAPFFNLSPSIQKLHKEVERRIELHRLAEIVRKNKESEKMQAEEFKKQEEMAMAKKQEEDARDRQLKEAKRREQETNQVQEEEVQKQQVVNADEQHITLSLPIASHPEVVVDIDNGTLHEIHQLETTPTSSQQDEISLVMMEFFCINILILLLYCVKIV